MRMARAMVSMRAMQVGGRMPDLVSQCSAPHSSDEEFDEYHAWIKRSWDTESHVEEEEVMESQSMKWPDDPEKQMQYVEALAQFGSQQALIQEKATVGRKIKKCFGCVSFSCGVIKSLVGLLIVGACVVGGYMVYTSFAQVGTAVSKAIDYPVSGLKDCFTKGDLKGCYRGFMPIPALLTDKLFPTKEGDDLGCRKLVAEYPPDGVPCNELVTIPPPRTDLEFFKSELQRCGHVFNETFFKSLSEDCCYGGLLTQTGELSFVPVTSCSWKGNFTEIISCPCEPVTTTEPSTTTRSRRVKRI
jgi:hypothetical protein